MSKPWTKKPFDCCKNPPMCFMPSCVPCGYQLVQACTVGVVYKETGCGTACWRAFCCSVCLCSFGGAYNRTKIRHKLELKGNCFVDLLFHLFCPCCAVVQEWRQGMETTLGNDAQTIFNYISAKSKSTPAITPAP